MPPVEKFSGCFTAIKSAKDLTGDCALMVMTRGSDEALPIHDIFVRSKRMPSRPIIWA